MIHPQYWSLYSVWCKLRGITYEALTPEDIRAYSLLPVRGKVVLDVGAYIGDSASLFLKNGARKVIAIEPYYHDKIPRDPRIEVIPERFELRHLDDLEYDVIKVDIEGWEEILLDYDKPLKPCVVEVHGQQLWKKFEDRGWEYVSKSRLANCTALMRNFKPGAVRA